MTFVTLREEILEVLKKAEKPLTGQEIADAVKTSRPNAAHNIGKLCREGYNIKIDTKFERAYTNPKTHSRRFRRSYVLEKEE